MQDFLNLYADEKGTEQANKWQVWSGDKKKGEEMSGRGETNVRAIVHEIKKIPQNSPAWQSALWLPTHIDTHSLYLLSFFPAHILFDIPLHPETHIRMFSPVYFLLYLRVNHLCSWHSPQESSYKSTSYPPLCLLCPWVEVERRENNT